MTINSLKFNPTSRKPDRSTDDEITIYRTAIIGAGPKGLYGLERLLAALKKEKPEVPVAVHVFNRSPFFGAGDVYRPDQPGYLLMNFSNGNINMWPKEGAEPVVPEARSFVEWLKENKQGPAEPDAYASRAQVGAYLSEGFEQLRRYCPDGVQIVNHVAEVTDVIPEGDAFFLELETAEGKVLLEEKFDQLLLTTGHPRPHAGFPELEIQIPEKSKLRAQLIDTIYPVQEQLGGIRSGEKVILKGLGLTFIDAVLALTEGRGGQFSENPEKGLTYRPSGLEPHKIYPYSRSGLPMFPRLGEVPDSRPALNFFNENKLDAQLAGKEKIDFKKELLPLIEQEFIANYYRVLFRNYGEELEISDDFAGILRQIEVFHRSYPQENRFSLGKLFSPLPQPAFGLHGSFLTFLDEFLSAARAGREQSPLAAAAATWRSISPVFNKYYSFGRLTPASQRQFLEKYAGHFNRLAYGPPVANLEKIRAIAAAGCLDFSFVRSPGINFRRDLNCFMITHPQHALHTTAFYWVDARIPKVQIGQDESELYQNLLERRIIRKYANTDGKESYFPGCLDLNGQGHPRDTRGRPVPQITVYGTPTEGITYDNDTLSRTRNNFADSWSKTVTADLRTKVKR